MLSTILKIIVIITVVVIIMSFPWDKLIKNLKFVSEFSGDMEEFNQETFEELSELKAKSIKVITEAEAEKERLLMLIQKTMTERTKMHQEMLQLTTFTHNIYQNIQALSTALETSNSKLKDECISKYVNNMEENMKILDSVFFKQDRGENENDRENDEYGFER